MEEIHMHPFVFIVPLFVEKVGMIISAFCIDRKIGLGG